MTHTRNNESPPRLIVNADDFGISPAINAEILTCIEPGILTSVSLMPGGPAATDAIAAAQNFPPTVGAGVHLTLDTIPPVLPPTAIPDLTTRTGRFLPPPALIFALLTQRQACQQVRKEWAAQIETVIKSGLRPDHLDGHRHLHVLPSLTPIVVQLAREYHIPAVRLPLDHFTTGKSFSRLPARLALRAAATLSKPKLKPLARPDLMLGFSTAGHYSENLFLRDISLLKNGQTAEAMFHPGPADIDIPDYRTWDYNWSVDSATLRSAQVKDRIDQLGIKLITFRQLTPPA